MKCLVTGGAGFIGSALCRRLLAAGHDVVNLDALSYAASEATLEGLAEHAAHRFEHADIRDHAAVRRIFAEHRPEAVFHLAAETHVDRSITEPGAFVGTNVVGAYVLLQEALDYWNALPTDLREAFRFVHVSTDEVYGSLGPEGVFTEETPYAPRSPYAASKAAADHLALAWFHTYGLPVIVSNCSNNYGPYQFPEKLVPLMILKGLGGQPLPVYGDGGQVRDWLHVDDHAAALEAIVAKGAPGEKYNVGARSERTNLQVVEAICDALDEMSPATGGSRRDLISFVADRPGHDRRYAIDPSKVERELGWCAQTRLADGLRDTVRWYIDRRGWWEPLQGRYAGQRLGLAEPV